MLLESLIEGSSWRHVLAEIVYYEFWFTDPNLSNQHYQLVISIDA